ncbi:MAG TPA: bifunctional methylenetetrahydrofolate dehydrogenase/methenyltetrahydrofolate cyclohydrolase FolD [Smithellaceae bacterium]|nr:bifunctional methylenetetrahydrofolate dehydrogenase/methenyltetrahydrofolate cyclohydrolase FolD [Smithellaceae bacterium]
MAIIIDGGKIAQDIRNEVRLAVQQIKEKNGIAPGLAVILVGDDPASRVYVGKKAQDCAEVGFLSRVEKLPSDTGENKLLHLIKELNADKAIHGILVQLPVPKQINTEKIIEAIDPCKDVDGFHPYNVGRLVAGSPDRPSCTPYGIMELLDRSGVAIAGKEAVIVGRSNIVGKPMALMLLARHATITVCHTKTKDLAAVTRRADILVAAAGKEAMIRGDMVKDGVVVIDVGTNRSREGKLVGDVAFAEVAPRASYITPVPGGVGPMTRAMLMKNTLKAAQSIIAG